ncbi:MAG: class I SAM-dependent methyltransferase [Thermoanaerobaculia bacterium]|nr:class I SAM-dependent methyltransferase [Thermoanaerobaculia bacterium]
MKRVPSRAAPHRPPDRWLSLLDESARRIRPDDAQLESWFAAYVHNHRHRLAMDLQLLAEHVEPGAQVLEYGAVPLLLTTALADNGYDVTGLDLAPERFASSIAEVGLEVTRCDIETEPVPFSDSSFDLVLFNELFEHLRIDPIFTLGEMLRVLRPGGTLLLSTPNLRSLRGLKNLLLHNQAHAVSGGVFEQWQKLGTLGHMGHVREYTVREVCDFLGHLGLRVERIVYRGGHGRGVVGLVERLAPSLRPFFTVEATRP